MGKASVKFKTHSAKQELAFQTDKRIGITATGIQWGKCIATNTKVLTDTGYRIAKDIKLGDILFDRNGEPTKVIGVYHQGLRDCYRIELTDRKSFIVSEDHLNIVKRRGYAKEEIINTKDLYKRKCIWGGRSKAQIPSASPFKFAPKNYLISPYLMGVLLGDGGITKSVAISSADDELIERVKKELPEGFKIKKRGLDGCDWSIVNAQRQHNHKGYPVNKIVDELDNLNLLGCKSENKFIPDIYKYGSIEQRLDLLRGLMDTDGTTDKNKKIEFYSVSEQLADDVIYLVESLGGKAWKLSKNSSYKKNGEKIQCKICYRVNIIIPLFNAFWLKRKAEKYFIHENTTNKLIKNIEPIGKIDCICFEVDSPTKTYVIEGQIVTHNTSVGVIWLINQMFKHNFKSANFLVTSPTYKILYQSTMPVFDRLCGRFGKFNKKDENFKLHNGGTVWFRTGQNPDSVVGITDIYAVLCDEAGLYSRYFWDNIQARSSIKEAPVRIVTSPYSLNWLYTDYIRPYHNEDSFILDLCCLVQARSNENPYFPAAEYELKQRTMDPRRFNMIYGGAFDKAQGLVYDVFDAKTMAIEPMRLPLGTRFFGGIDWGHTDPAVLKVRGITEDGMHYAVDEHYQTQMKQGDYLEQAARLRALWNVEKWYADPSRPDHISYLNQHGITTIGAANDIEPGIEAHYGLIKSGYYAVFKNSNKHTLDEYETYHYPDPADLKPDQNQNKRINLPVDQNNHTMDAERYITFNTLSIGRRRNVIVKDENSLVKAQTVHHDRVTRLEKLKKRKPNNHADL